MKEITNKQIEHLADLSSLSLTDSEKTKMKKDLEQILTFVDEIEKVDASNINIETSSVKLSELREDVAKQSISQETALKNAPAKENGAYVVPKVVD